MWIRGHGRNGWNKKKNEKIHNMKKVVYLDMDGVVTDFDARLRHYHSELGSLNKDERQKLVDQTYEENPRIFLQLEPIKGAVEAINTLLKIPEADLYFLSTTMWDVPEGYTDKQRWLEKSFGSAVLKKLIITQRKDLKLGDFLVEGRPRSGTEGFEGEHIHFGTADFPNWTITLEYLKNKIREELNEDLFLSLISIRTRKLNKRKKQ
jgi:5'-nucleotidase